MLHRVMHATSQDALCITGEANSRYHEPNSGCTFQDQGGVIVGDDCLIGHNTLLTTLNHDLAPSSRGDMVPSRVVLGRNVWIGSNVTVLPGVTIGDNAVVGSPARVTRSIDPAG